MHLRAEGDTAADVDTVVVARVLALEAEHKVKLSLLQTALKEEVDLLKGENRRLCEKLQREVCLKEGLEKVRWEPLGRRHRHLLGAPVGRLGCQPADVHGQERAWSVCHSGQTSLPSAKARAWPPVAPSTGPQGLGAQPGVLRGHRRGLKPGSLARPPSGLVPQSSGGVPNPQVFLLVVGHAAIESACGWTPSDEVTAPLARS